MESNPQADGVIAVFIVGLLFPVMGLSELRVVDATFDRPRYTGLRHRLPIAQKNLKRRTQFMRIGGL